MATGHPNKIFHDTSLPCRLHLCEQTLLGVCTSGTDDGLVHDLEDRDYALCLYSRIDDLDTEFEILMNLPAASYIPKTEAEP